MQKPAIFVLAVWIVMSFATLVQADDFELIAREVPYRQCSETEHTWPEK